MSSQQHAKEVALLSQKWKNKSFRYTKLKYSENKVMLNNKREASLDGNGNMVIQNSDNFSITAVVYNTLGELFFSNPCKLEDVIKDKQHMNQNAFGGGTF